MNRPRSLYNPAQTAIFGFPPWGDRDGIGEFIRRPNTAIWLGKRLKIRWGLGCRRVPVVNNRTFVYVSTSS
mgnify:CR=1 FL=1